MQEIDQTGVSPNHSSRYGAAVKLFVLHTQEGAGTAQSLANYLQNPASQVSYHYSIDDHTCVDVVDTDRAAWAVLDANSYSINLCFAGSFSAMSRQQWLDQFSQAIDYAAKILVQDSGKYDPLSPRVINYADVAKGLAGCTDHRGITVGLGIGTHVDVGRGFPWDVFMDAVNKHLTGTSDPAKPVVNAIDALAAVTPWLGGRISTAELDCPDNVGRFVQFEHGYIYWTPATRAVAVPTSIFETWATHSFESGALGYPVASYNTLPVGSSTPVGDVQAFQNGTIYRRYGQPGFYVTGAIGERWKRSGFENGTFGWPISDEIHFSGGVYQEFDHGRIVWSPDDTVGLEPHDGPDTIVPAEVH